MKIINQIKKEVNDLDNKEYLDHLTEEEKTNLPYLIKYYLSKNMPYFEDRYEVLRLASIEDEDLKNTLSFGYMSLNKIDLHTNQSSGGFIFDDPWGESLKDYFLTEKDIKLLDKALKIIESSSNLDELINNIDEEVEENPDFLYHYSYLMKDKIEILGYNGSELILDSVIYLDKNKHENNDMVKKYKKKIYFNSVGHSPVESIINRALTKIINSRNIESEIERMFKESNIDTKRLTKNKQKLNAIDLNSPEMIVLKNKKKSSSEIKKILYNEKIFKKSKFKSKTLIKNKLLHKNENEIINKYKKEIDKVLSVILYNNPILKSNKDINYEVKLHKKDEQNSFIIEGNLREEIWSLGDWDKDKGLSGYNYSSQEYIEQKKDFPQEYISVGNELENVAFIQFNRKKDVIRWRVADCGKDDPKIMFLVLEKLKEYSKKHNVKAVHLDIITDQEYQRKNDFRRDVLIQFIKEDESDIVYFETSGGLMDYEKNRLFLDKYALGDWEYKNVGEFFAEKFDVKTRKEMKEFYKEIIDTDLNTIKDINKKNRRKRLGLTL
jgi:hypothetical protein